MQFASGDVGVKEKPKPRFSLTLFEVMVVHQLLGSENVEGFSSEG